MATPALKAHRKTAIKSKTKKPMSKKSKLTTAGRARKSG
jgi:hypothetical protein